MKISFIGLGNMGTAIADICAKNGHNVLGWDYTASVVNEINKKSSNSSYLKGVPLSKNLKATANITEAAEFGDIIFAALPSKFIEAALTPLKSVINKSQAIVNLSKGINSDTKQTSYQLIKSIFPENNVVMLSGPSIANEAALEMQTAVVLASHDNAVKTKVSKALDNNYFKTVHSNDFLGVELAGILKNIYAIGFGIFDGGKVASVNFRALYFTLALREIAAVVSAMGGSEQSVYYIAGMGDLFATSQSSDSHNRHFGELLAQGFKLSQIEEKVKIFPEGYNTLNVFTQIAKEKNINFALALAIAEVIKGKATPEQFKSSIMKLI